MDIKTILSLVALGIDVLVILFYVVLFLVNKFKKMISKEDYEVKNEDLEAINQLLEIVVPNAIMNAEKAGILPGNIKKNLAQGEIRQECINRGIDYNHYNELIDNTIENMIKITKEVNAKK